MPYRFGSFVFDPARGLFDAGERVPLEPQALDLLRYLLENRDRIVTREELIDGVWDGRIVSDAALSTQIRAIRRALGDDKSQQRYIRTHPKRGFEFVAPVNQTDDTGDALAAGSGRQPGGWSAIRLRVAVVATIVALTAALSVGYWLTGRSAGQSSAEPPKLSIAVMPFDNLSGDPEQEYFADAITEDLITDLSRIREAFVIARRTSFTYKDRAVDLRNVATELNVRYVVEGSVRRSGDQVRINAQLIDGKTGSHVWSDRFDRELTDVFSVQNDVTGRIASVLKAELREADERRPPASMKAWDYALKGNVLLFNPTSFENYQNAKVFLDKAIGLDPTILSAWSGLAFVHYAASMRPIPGVSVPNSKGLSLRAAQRAVELDPKNAEGHWIIGVGYARNGQPDIGLASCETAVDLNPNNDCAYVCRGLVNMALGRPGEAVLNFEQSLRLNPRFRPFTKYKYMGLAYLHSGQDEEAIETLNRAIAGSPNDPLANFALTAALSLAGRVTEARDMLRKSLTLAYGDETTVETMRASYSWMGPGFERVVEGLRIAGLREQ